MTSWRPEQASSTVPLRIGIDFDGTMVEHRFPEIGAEVPESVRVVRRISDAGHIVVVWSCRSGRFADDAMAWFRRRDMRVRPAEWSPPRPPDRPWKTYVDVYIDDRALGVPLVAPAESGLAPYVDWLRVEVLLQERGILA